MTADRVSRSRGLDLGIALAPSAAMLREGLDKWLAPVAAGHFDSVWSLENPLADQAEPLVWLSAATSLAPTAGVGTAALIAPTRSPVLLARQLATLDHLAEGRLTVGVTIGRRPADYNLTGTEFNKRGRILDETLLALRAIWSGEALDIASPFWTLESPARVGIEPRRSSGPPLLVGGHAEPALRRAARLADGFLAGATSGPAHALSTHARVLGLLDDYRRDHEDFIFVASLFVYVAASRAEAMSAAGEALHARHGSSPPYDPEEVIVGGTADEVASTICQLHDAGYQGVNLVPVAMTISQVDALVGVSELLADRRR